MIEIDNIEKEVDEAMEYINKMEKIELDNYFDIRVENRIRELEKEDQINAYPFYKKVLQPAFIVLLCIINIVIMFYFIKSSSKINDYDLSAEETYVNAMETTYSLEQNSLDLGLIKTMKNSNSGES